MTNHFFTEEVAYKFIKVEQYFENYASWDTLEKVTSHSFESETNTLILNFEKNDGTTCTMLIQLVQEDIFRVRFNPSKNKDNYTVQNTRSIIQDNIKGLQQVLALSGSFSVEVINENESVSLTTKVANNEVMELEVSFAPFSIKVFNQTEGGRGQLVWQTAEKPIFFTANGNEDYAIIQAVNKPTSATYIGFGEHGGSALSKNKTQMTYFNFDNMRYRQVYDQGPLDQREPLYHSEPFFLEYNDYVNGIFVDNPGQICMDIGHIDDSKYKFGTRFGDLDYYFFLGNSTADVVKSFTSIVGRSRLKPRYILGYHQGCYGYERRDIVEWAVDKYRAYKIPLDGMHIDVDIQKNYQTFTIDTQKFPNPNEMFKNLRANGIKCSTNITPVISREDSTYETYKEANENQYFVIDKRYNPENPNSKMYQLYGGGNEYSPNNGYVEGFDSGQPYIGGVYYGNDANNKELGTSGHYPDLGRKEVRHWWGTQYQYLFDMGLEMVWQDMTTPAIRDYRGDMKGFPFRLKLTNDFLSETQPQLTPVIKVWNLFSYNLHKATYHGLNNLKGRENKRNFIIGRGSFTGSHRFAGLWTGDNSSDWDFLKINITQTLSLGMCGVVINGQDIGGFETAIDGGSWASPELLIRWTTLGAFLPWFRNHYVRKGRKEFQEPFMYEEWFNEYKGGVLPQPQELYKIVLPICKYYIELRYRLMQVFYDAMFENSINGLPICRPLFLNDYTDKSLFSENKDYLANEFFVSKFILVAPIVDPQIKDGVSNYGKRNVYLPKGNKWYCFTNNTQPLNEAIEGGSVINFDANLNVNGNHIQFITPVFVADGAIIPTLEIEQYVGQLNEEGKYNPITLNIYPGDTGTYTMYLDDGISRSSTPVETHPLAFGGDDLAKGEYRQTDITHHYSQSNKTREITIDRVHDNYTPFEKYFFVAVIHDPSYQNGLAEISVNGVSITRVTGHDVEKRSTEFNNTDSNAWYFNENINIDFIKVFDAQSNILISIKYQ
ncbi:MAG: TIM-barrel domain-containing protein [Ferruginibacter sp.]